MTTRLIILLCGLLFIFNSDVCDHFYDSATQTAEWWNLRFKFYSGMWVLMLLAVLLNVGRISKIVTVPVLALFVGDFKDRVFFEYTDRHWSDWALVAIAIIVSLIIYKHDRARGSVEDNT